MAGGDFVLRHLTKSRWILALLLVGCYGSRESDAHDDGASGPQTPSGAAGGSAPMAPGRPSAGPRAGGAGRAADGGSAGSGGCAANREDGGLFDTTAYLNIGGAGAWIAGTCSRCGWAADDDACQSLVYAVPTITDPDYSTCLDESLAFADCLQHKSCVCDGGVPAACKDVETKLERCLSGGNDGEDAPFTGFPDNWLDVKTPCSFSFKSPGDYQDKPVQGLDSCVLEFDAGYCHYSADYGPFNGSFGPRGDETEYHERSENIDGRPAQLVSFTSPSFPGSFVAGVYFGQGLGGTGLTMMAKCDNTAGPIEAHALFRTIRFER